jgi:hypothetical protein
MSIDIHKHTYSVIYGSILFGKYNTFAHLIFTLVDWWKQCSELEVGIHAGGRNPSMQMTDDAKKRGYLQIKL